MKLERNNQNDVVIYNYAHVQSMTVRQTKSRTDFIEF